MLKGAGLVPLGPELAPSNQPASQRESGCRIQVEGLWWERACNKTQGLVRKSLSLALAIKRGQNDSGTQRIKEHPCFLL